jgi:hypothetical protein
VVEVEVQILKLVVVVMLEEQEVLQKDLIHILHIQLVVTEVEMVPLMIGINQILVVVVVVEQLL